VLFRSYDEYTYRNPVYLSKIGGDNSMSSYQKIGCFLFCILLLTACGDSDHNANNVPEAQQSNSEGSFQLQDDIDNINDYIDYSNSDLKTVYFAGGCFWGVEAF